MSEKKDKKSNRMVYTRECHIPIGEAVITENGEMGLRIKKAKSPETETVSIGALFADVAKAVGLSATATKQ